jgi:hypothetical protein
VFVVALRDGYFVFLDSFFDEDSLYQKEVRAILVSFALVLSFFSAFDVYYQSRFNFVFLCRFLIS